MPVSDITPAHYKLAGGMEVDDVIEAILMSQELTPYEGWLLGNVLKYVSRFKKKGGLNDLEKASNYLAKLRIRG